METAQPAVRLDGVQFTTDRFRLGPIHLEVPRGYVTAIVGPNGSGKSSTFRLLLDLIKPEAGTIELLGSRPHSRNPELRQRLAYVPETNSDCDEGLRASEKAAFHQLWYPTWDVNRYQELLRRFDVDPSVRLGKMSKGMRQKLELALALAHQPELLLLDEPSSGLDPIAWKHMLETLSRYMEDGSRTILVASHLIEEVRRLADYIVVMSRGQVLGVYEKDALFDNWRTYYLIGDGLEERMLTQGPGVHAVERMGGQAYKLISSASQSTEQWLHREALPVTGQQPMELDDIMEALIARQQPFS
ncbi:ABC transporter ATP-binding protein [Paenibacillus sp. IB182496]|uniref:ABC transporter ATP-binding protein n=1 Tax=Paenibacillus sabuli TaxID=2772509 RepID=A0A927BXM3_9BACL|nr:ABC transporter ATP-binding protein [Paenibacillus sabuli]MBD2847369.1 ABC transporter ATP-binding protein [Paenibacillus sabuli]